MVIIGIIGGHCAGKTTVAELLQRDGFVAYDLRKTHWEEVLTEVKNTPAGNWVVYPVTREVHRALAAFTFYKLLWVDAAVGVRFSRWAKGGSVEDFIAVDEEHCFLEGEYALRKGATLVLNNGDKDQLEERVRKIPHTCKKMRKNWDSFYMSFAHLAARRSNCMKTPVGSVIVSDNRIVSCGYNGTPMGWRNCIEGGCKRCNENSGQGKHLDKCYCVHAEVNSILYAGRYVCQGGTLYATMMPCLNCAKTIVQVGIARIVFHEDYSDVDSQRLLSSIGIKVGKVPPDDSPYLV